MKKIYNNGLVVGRFEPIHLGHQKLIDKALEIADKTLIMVTTSKTDKIDIDKRINLIKMIYSNEIASGCLRVVKFNNPSHFDLSYGTYIFNEYYNATKTYPNVIIYGNDKDISKCFNDELISRLDTVVIKRDGNSSTLIRTLLKENKELQVKRLISKKIESKVNKAILLKGDSDG